MSSSGPFFTSVPPITEIQNCFWASTSFTVRRTWPIVTPTWFGSTSCARAGAAARMAMARKAKCFISLSRVRHPSVQVAGRMADRLSDRRPPDRKRNPTAAWHLLWPLIARVHPSRHSRHVAKSSVLRTGALPTCPYSSRPFVARKDESPADADVPRASAAAHGQAGTPRMV